MTDSTSDPGPSGEAGAESSPGSPPGVPRWVKAFGIVVIVLLLVLITLRLTGIGGQHGPGRHGGGGNLHGGADAAHDLAVDDIGLHLAASGDATVTAGLVFNEPGSSEH